jgi:hypothetical protein
LKQWLEQLKLAGDLDAMNCFVKRVDKNGKEREICVMDTSVYGNDRCFRTLYSDRYEQNRPLKVYRYKGKQAQDQLKHFLIFQDNIIQYILPEQEAFPIVKRKIAIQNIQNHQSFATNIAHQLSKVYDKIISEKQYKSFNMLYHDFPLNSIVQDYVKSGIKPKDLVEPFDGFHPSQIGQSLIAKGLYEWLEKEHSDVLGPINPHNELIEKLFGEQG